MPSDVLPYFVPSGDTVKWGQWNLIDGEVDVPLPDYIEGWEPGTNIRIRRSFEIDAARFESETQCSINECRVHLTWLSSTTGMVGSAEPIAIPRGEGTIDVELVGAKIAGTLSLYSRIVFALRPNGDGPIGAARLPGSILAEDKQLLKLEQPAAMFPIQLVDFARTSFSAEASWHLDFDGDLESPFMGAVLLQINRRDTVLREAISHSETANDGHRILTEVLESGVSALLIDLAIAYRDELLENEWQVDSVGDVLRNTLLRADLMDAMPPSPGDLSSFRTRIEGAVRRMGHGRLFR